MTCGRLTLYGGGDDTLAKWFTFDAVRCGQVELVAPFRGAKSVGNATDVNEQVESKLEPRNEYNGRWQ